MKFKAQHDQMDCGPACLAMISSHYGKDFTLQYLRDQSFLTRDGVSLLGMREAAEKVGFKCTAAQFEIEDFEENMLPCIIHWNQNHFVVIYKISKSLFTREKIYKIADPSHGFISLSEEKFKKSWVTYENKGVALFLEPTKTFYENNFVDTNKVLVGKMLIKYLKPYKVQIGWLILLLLLGTITTIILPFLTQKLIDDGVNKKNMNMIVYILLAQLAFFFGNIVFNVFRNWITLITGTKINIQIISEFLEKLLKLPLKFFDTKMVGDFNQRIQDHERIEQFVTSESILTIFSLATFSVFMIVLAYYDYKILTVYLILTLFSILWSIYWLKKRKILDYFRFKEKSLNQDAIYEIINGVSEMKLNQFEDYKRREWEQIQQKLFKVNIRILKVDQIQFSGFEFINQFKNIIVTFIAATLVVSNHISLGELLSVSYIIGQMNNPISRLIFFFRSSQDAKLSLSRLNEVQNQPEEETENLKDVTLNQTDNFKKNKMQRGIRLMNLSFQYEGPKSPFVLKEINLFVPEGKITAIVGASGSGKTTLMKLLLKFYKPTTGSISYNEDDIATLSPKSIRENCGVVLQDGYIFSDTIKRNIATADENIKIEKLKNAIHIANVEEFISNLPLKSNTKIGASGNGISGGQKQRILIARAVYKNPHYIFFDEATSALDAKNEKIIHDNLQSFFKGKTVLIIAHRLSTVKNADQIIVLEHGEIVEKGAHRDLVNNRSKYYDLVKNQLELGA